MSSNVKRNIFLRLISGGGCCAATAVPFSVANFIFHQLEGLPKMPIDFCVLLMLAVSVLGFFVVGIYIIAKIKESWLCDFGIIFGILSLNMGAFLSGVMLIPYGSTERAHINLNAINGITAGFAICVIGLFALGVIAIVRRHKKFEPKTIVSIICVALILVFAGLTLAFFRHAKYGISAAQRVKDNLMLLHNSTHDLQRGN